MKIALRPIFLVVAASGALFFSFRTTAPTADPSPQVDPELTAKIEAGQQLVSTICNTCHAQKDSHDAQLAPPFFAVKKHYIQAETSYEAFKTAFMAFTADPSTERSKMPGAVKKFGLMPKYPLTAEQYETIAAYLYYEDLMQPKWFEAHEREQHGEDADHRVGNGLHQH